MFQDGECLLPKVQRRIRNNLASQEGEEVEVENNEEKFEQEAIFQSSQSQRNFIIKGLEGLEGRQFQAEVQDVFAALKFLHEHATMLNNKVHILWIGCKNFEVVKRVVLLSKRLKLDCNILVVERDEDIEVPDEIKSSIAVFKEEFLHFSCYDLFDLIYNSVDTTASTVFNLKLLCCCYLYHKPNLLLLSHELLFQQIRTMRDQSSNKKEKQLFSSKEQKELLSFVRLKFKCLWKDSQFWHGKAYFIKVSYCLK